jgi:hypothetical protein
VPSILVDGFVLALAFSPAVPHLVEVARRKSNWNRFIDSQSYMALIHVLPETRLVGIALLTTGVITAIRYRRGEILQRVRRRWLPMMYCLAWLMIPTLTAVAMNDAVRLFYRRYLLAMMPASYVLVGMFVSIPDRRPLRILVAGVVLTCATYWSSAIDLWTLFVAPPLHAHENWRDAVSRINHNPLPLVLVRPHLIEDDYLRGDTGPSWRAYCLLPVNGPYRIAERGTIIEPLPSTDPGRLDHRQRNALIGAGRAWLLFRGSQQVFDGTIDQIRASLWPDKRRLEITMRERYGENLTLVGLVLREIPDASRTCGPVEFGPAGWAQTYRIQNWRLVKLWAMEHAHTPILNSVRPSLCGSSCWSPLDYGVGGNPISVRVGDRIRRGRHIELRWTKCSSH